MLGIGLPVEARQSSPAVGEVYRVWAASEQILTDTCTEGRAGVLDEEWPMDSCRSDTRAWGPHLEMEPGSRDGDWPLRALGVEPGPRGWGLGHGGWSLGHGGGDWALRALGVEPGPRGVEPGPRGWSLDRVRLFETP